MPTKSTILTVESSEFACDGLHVARFHGKEAIGRLFRYGVLVKCDTLLDRAAVLGATITVRMDRSYSNQAQGRDQTETLRFHGMIAGMREALSKGEPDEVTLVIRPRVWDLTQIKTQEVFLGKSVIEVITEKLTRHGFAKDTDFELAVDDTLYSSTDGATLEGNEVEGPRLIVQYGETDYAFISRLAERAGISMYFRHDEDREVLVFTDSNSGFHRLPDDRDTIEWNSYDQHSEAAGLRRRTRVIPNTFIAQDYNYRAPVMGVMAEQVELSVDPTVDGALPGAIGSGVAEITPNFKTQAEGQWTAKLLAERSESQREVYKADSSNPRIFAGGRFRLENHPHFSEKESDLIITKTSFYVAQQIAGCSTEEEKDYGIAWEAVCGSKLGVLGQLDYRPPLRTRRPRIHGVVTAVVTGPNYDVAGAMGQTQTLDNRGRYEVHFHFDPSPDSPAKSHRIRMAQPHVGEAYGHHFPLRPGAEVLLAFIDGDPDRPVILGGVPHRLLETPVTSDVYELNRIRTRSGILVEIADGTPETSS